MSKRSLPNIRRSCWCGAHRFEPFGPGYLCCLNCNTLVGQAGLTNEQTLVVDDASDYYGKRYWLEHQRDDLQLPDIYTRARQDLPGRCVLWLETLLRYRRPPARVLEIGAGHGAYTALLRAAGFEATALDLSPWVADFAVSRFGIPYLVGPVEAQQFDAGSFDIVVANDLLEHLADPAETLAHCADVLTSDGVLVIQTPEFPLGRSYADLVTDDDPFLEHMRRAQKEHLYLFSRDALELLLCRAGFRHTRFEDAPYDYDMLCVGGKRPLRKKRGDAARFVGTATSAPLALALIDANDARRVSESDRANRLLAVERLHVQIEEDQADRMAKERMIEHLDAALKASEAQLAESEADRSARLELIERLDAELRASEADGGARLELIERLGRELQASEEDRSARLELIERLDAKLSASEEDRQARLELIQQLDGDLRALREQEMLRSVLAG